MPERGISQVIGRLVALSVVLVLACPGAFAVAAPEGVAVEAPEALGPADSAAGAVVEQAKAAKLAGDASADSGIASLDEYQAGYIYYTSHMADYTYSCTQGSAFYVSGLATDHNRWNYYYAMIGVWDWVIEDYVLVYGPSSYVSYELPVAANIDTSSLAISSGRYDVDLILIDAYYEEFEDMQTIGLDITSANRPPISNADMYTTHVNTPKVVAAPGVLANDSDPDNTPLTAVKWSDPSHGTVVLNSNGSFTYTPAAGYIGSDSFMYRAFDGVFYSDAELVSISVTNSTPFANDDTYGVHTDTPKTVSAADGLLKNDGDADGDLLTALKVTDPTHGTVSVNADGSFTYTPAAGYTGNDSFTYRAFDGYAYSSTRTVTILVGNQVPQAFTNSYDVHSGTTLTVAAPGVLDNDSDLDADPLTAHLVTPPASGTLTLNLDGSFTYTPDPGFGGVALADSFYYQAYDGFAYSSSTRVLIRVMNETPVATDDNYDTRMNQTLVGTSVLTNDTDGDDDALTAEKVTDPAHGTLVLNTDGTFTYTPETDFRGIDTFTYRAYDGTAYSMPVTVVIGVNESAPTAMADSYTTEPNTAKIVAAPGVLANDQDSDADSLTAEKVSDPTHGTVTLNTDGSFTYTPSAGYKGTDSFTYKAYDGFLYSSPVAVTITVADPYSPLPVYRFYRPSTGTHFYTADVTERDRVRNTMSSTYSYEGPAYTINLANPANSVPLYRFYNVRTGTHLYTADESEKNNILARLAGTYSLDGVAYRVSMSSGTEVHRFYNIGKGVHFYSADPAEIAYVRAALGATWRYEGRAYFVGQ